jgi:hypothetical protein
MSASKQEIEPSPANGQENDAFIATATAVSSPYITEARVYLEVVAPATLPEVSTILNKLIFRRYLTNNYICTYIFQGYTFEAQVNRRTFMVTVPAGGVEEGQKFSVATVATVGSSVVLISGSSISVGHWRVSDCPSLCGAVYIICKM